MVTNGISIAIDGPAGAGKSTIAKIVAEKLGYIYVDTGAMYRSITYKALQNGVDVDDASEFTTFLSSTKIEFENCDDGQHVILDGVDVTEQIRTREVNSNVSAVSALEVVRIDLVERQKKIGALGEVVMDGRDIGTVVLPEAELKIFMTASVEERANRRHNENISKGIDSDYEVIKNEIAKRDEYDSNREVSPLTKSEDAVFLDTTSMTIDEVASTITKYALDIIKLDAKNITIRGNNKMTEEITMQDVLAHMDQSDSEKKKGKSTRGSSTSHNFDEELDYSFVESKLESGEIFEAEVSDAVKGGLIVQVEGVRAFVPASMVSTSFVEDLTIYKGKTLEFKVIEIDREKNRVILSHKVVMKMKEAVEAKEVLSSLEIGSVLEGEVVRTTNFGAFVRIGKVEGLVHLSEISHNRVKSAEEALSIGDKVSVKILNVDVDSNRLSLSIKATQKGPWESIGDKLFVGAVLPGTVKRLTNFGAFVEVFPGVEGLTHISQIAHKHIKSPQEVLRENEQVTVKVIGYDFDNKKLSLSIKALLENPEAEENFDYDLPESATGFSLGDMFDSKLNKK